MTRKKSEKKYITTVKKFGNGARICAFKEHIGKIAIVRIKEGLKDGRTVSSNETDER